jgi:hypothetical protein
MNFSSGAKATTYCARFVYELKLVPFNLTDCQVY